jgi:hypothetical protein
MRVLATIVLRTSRPEEAHGFLVAIDWTRRRVLRTMAAPALNAELGVRSRGGRRGFRGLALHGGHVWLASADAIYLLDPSSLAVQGIVSHRFMGSIHDLFADGDGVWVTCTSADGIFKVDESQNVIDQRWVKGEPRQDLRVHSDDALDTLHVNGIFRYGGDLHFYAAFTGEVYRVTPGGAEVVDRIEPMCHNVFRDERGYFRAVSPHSEIRYGDQSVAMPRVGPAGEFANPGWLRGFAQLPGGHVLVGSSPARLVEVDLDARRVVGQFVLKDDPNWTISGIALLPGEASDPPGMSPGEAAHAGRAESDAFDPYPELVRLAYVRFETRAYADALDLFRVCLQLEERYEQEVVDGLRFHVALCHFFLGDYPRGLAELERLESQAVGPGVPRAALKYYQGLCHERLGDLERALAAFRQAPTEGLDPSLRSEIEQSRRRVEALTAR